MDIELKQKIAERIIQSDDDILLNEIKSLVGLSDRDFWDDLPADVKYGINKAKEEMDSGKGIPHAVVMEDIRNRFLRK